MLIYIYNFQSYHPKRVLKAIPYSQFLRVRIICTTLQTFKEDAKILFQALLGRGYPHHLVSDGYNRARDLDRGLLTDEGKEPNKLLILSTTYHHANPPWNLILGKHKPILELSPDCQRIALSNLCTAFKANPSLRNILVRAQLPDSNQQPQIPRGTQPCGRNCFCCKYIKTATNITSFHNGKLFRTRASGNCRTTGIIYLIERRRYHLQYVGQTGTELKTRLCNHISSIRRQDPEQPVAQHFSSSNYQICDVTVRIIDKPGNDIKKRLSFEQAWIDTIQTIQPWGLNAIEWCLISMIANCASAPSGVARHSDDTSERRTSKKHVPL